MNGARKWIRVTQCENIPLREGRAVKFGDREIAIFNLGDRFLAIDNRCPHKDGPLSEGIVSETTVVCPLHAWKIDLETGTAANQASPVSCVETYRVRVEDGVLLLELPLEPNSKQQGFPSCVEHDRPLRWVAPKPLARIALIVIAVSTIGGFPLFARQQQRSRNSPPSSAESSGAVLQPLPVSAQFSAHPGAVQEITEPDKGEAPNGGASLATTDDHRAEAKTSAPPSHGLGPLTVSVNWRLRTEAWDWFQPATEQNAYAFSHSLLRVGVGQKTEGFDWFLEAAQDAIVGLPTNAVLAGRSGQLGLGGTYFAANGNGQNNANGFVRQAYLGFNLPANGKVRLGRFSYLDGTEVTPQDKSLATLVNTRIAQRLIGDFGFSAVGRSFDGAQLSFETGRSNLTLLAARPTRGVYQVDGTGELDVDLFYGAYTVPVTTQHSAGELRVFAVGYVDERASVLKTDNRSVPARTADKSQIRIGTYGADYAHVFHTEHRGQFNFLVWGLLQNGSWGVQAQRAGAFVGELGWQPPVRLFNPWFSAGYSFGSGDSNPTDNTHGTFFQILPTPRPYARFPFYNMENNKDYYGAALFRFPHSLALRSELHALRLADAQDLWYLGGGPFQPRTFGYTGRTSGGQGSLANVWDVSLDLPVRYGFSVTTYYAHAWGKSVIASIYPTGTNAQFGYVETNFRF